MGVVVILGGQHSVVRVRAGQALDPYSRRPTDLDWDHPDQRRVRNVAVLAEDTAEATGRQQQTTQKVTFVAQGFPDVRATDRLRWRGSVYDVVGVPRRSADGIAVTVIQAQKVVG